ncbi:hypothetical protein ZHAS_00003902 [Anopheles sinensis]|uniref:Uncharacterized protein n=1 Tax=Anopheles sinensis TaxID=74873 RepID=A0A084VFJ6_ANOSI|nr:hypothetical protein ZHAS_00003902 [Anopheles sinensis]
MPGFRRARKLETMRSPCQHQLRQTRTLPNLFQCGHKELKPHRVMLHRSLALDLFGVAFAKEERSIRREVGGNGGSRNPGPQPASQTDRSPTEADRGGMERVGCCFFGAKGKRARSEWPECCSRQRKCAGAGARRRHIYIPSRSIDGRVMLSRVGAEFWCKKHLTTMLGRNRPSKVETIW